MKYNDFPEQDNPLYCFKLIEENESAYLNKYVITRYAYREYGQYSNKADYRFPGKFIHSKFGISAVNASKLNKISNNKLFTFDSSEENANKLFEEWIEQQLSDSEAEYSAAKQLHTLWQKGKEKHNEKIQNMAKPL